MKTTSTRLENGGGAAPESRSGRTETKRGPHSFLFYLVASVLAWQASSSLGFLQRVKPMARAAAMGSLEGQAQVEPPGTGGPGVELSPKQRQELLKSKYEKLKKDATDLAGLAKSLQDDIEASNQNVLDLKVADKAEKIEKLARRIKAAAKGE